MSGSEIRGRSFQLIGACGSCARSRLSLRSAGLRLFRRHPRFSFARTRAEAEWKSIFRAAAEERTSDGPLIASSLGPGATRLDRVQARRQTPSSRRERRIRGWIAPSAQQAMADRKALLARPSR